MSWSLINKTSITAGSGGGTSGNIDTTGSNLITITTAFFNGVSITLSVTDNQSNTYIRVPALGACTDEIWYCYNPTTNASHNFTVTGSSMRPATMVLAFNGAVASPLDQHSEGFSSSGNTGQGFAVTPSQGGELIISTVGPFTSDHGQPLGVSGGGLSWSIEFDIVFSSGNNQGAGIAWAVQTTAASINPIWTWTNTEFPYVPIATFKGPSSPASNTDGGLMKAA